MLKVKNTNDIRKIITEEIGLLKDDNSNPARANAIANLIAKLLYSVKLDIEVHRYVERSKTKDFSVPLINQTEKKQSKKRLKRKNKKRKIDRR